MSAVVDKNLDLIVAGWRDQIKRQEMRADGKRYPNDIAGIMENVHKYENGYIKTIAAFPIFHKDKPADVISKYCNTFTDEAYLFMQQLNELEKNLHHAKGMSKKGDMRLAFTIPKNLYDILHGYSIVVRKEPFPSNKWYKELRTIMPKCFIGEGMKNDKY